jgi:hypothetical protein
MTSSHGITNHETWLTAMRALLQRRDRGRWRAIWELDKEWRNLLRHHGRAPPSLNVYHEPTSDIKDIDGRDVALGLERAFRATGDQRFQHALAALRHYGLDCGSPRKTFERVFKEIYHGPEDPHIEQMKWLLDRKHAGSEREAAERVAAEYAIDGQSFEAVTKELRRRFKQWKIVGFSRESGKSQT